MSTKSNNSEFEVSTDSSRELYEDIIMEKAAIKGIATEKAKGKKVVAQESELPPKGLREKNLLFILFTYHSWLTMMRMMMLNPVQQG